jgi:hypothetical protein
MDFLYIPNKLKLFADFFLRLKKLKTANMIRAGSLSLVLSIFIACGNTHPLIHNLCLSRAEQRVQN